MKPPKVRWVPEEGTPKKSSFHDPIWKPAVGFSPSGLYSRGTLYRKRLCRHLHWPHSNIFSTGTSASASTIMLINYIFHLLSTFYFTLVFFEVFQSCFSRFRPSFDIFCCEICSATLSPCLFLTPHPLRSLSTVRPTLCRRGVPPFPSTSLQTPVTSSAPS